MKILYNTETEREGNDCMIYESVSLSETQGLYLVLTTKRVCGWDKYSDAQTFVTEDLHEAKKTYKKLGGKFNN